MKICVCQVKRIRRTKKQQKLFRAFSRLYLQSQKRCISLFCMLLFCFVLKQKHLVENKQQIISVKWVGIYMYMLDYLVVKKQGRTLRAAYFFFIVIQTIKNCRICRLNYNYYNNNNNYNKNNNCCQSVCLARSRISRVPSPISFSLQHSTIQTFCFTILLPH